MTEASVPVAAALAVAQQVAGEFPGSVVARAADWDVPPGSSRLPHRAPRNVVEILVDCSGVVVVGTGWDSARPAYVAQVPLPGMVCDLTVLTLRVVLRAHVRLAALAVARHVVPRSRGLFGL